jgi:hypothetical protein
MLSLTELLRIEKSKAEVSLVVVSGLPRSGTSMMMKMLEAGGFPILTDHVRSADLDNPKGYYEFERVKKLPEGDFDWLAHAGGKAVKIISALLEHLPPGYHYKIIFMQRKMEEILASQRQMLIRGEKPTDAVSDEQMAAFFSMHLEKVEQWLNNQPNISVLFVDYNDMVSDPSPRLSEVNKFLNNKLDLLQMARVVDRRLYRQRV